MTNIEFIEQFIKGTELTLNTYIQLQTEELSHSDIYDKSIEITKKELQHLQQIKAKLEAWEELTTLFYITIDNFGNLYISLGEETVNTLYEKVPEKYINNFKEALEANKNE